jgi:hypothetical protein
MTIADEISIMIKHLPENNQALILELIKTMIPLDDEPLTDEDESDIIKARAEREQGIYTRHEDINWE